VSSSANPGGARPAVAGFQVRRYFGADLAALLPGSVGDSARPSTIRDLATGQIIRA
jgi:L-threonylcarbamoyladenylate synthase